MEMKHFYITEIGDGSNECPPQVVVDAINDLTILLEQGPDGLMVAVEQWVGQGVNPDFISNYMALMSRILSFRGEISAKVTNSQRDDGYPLEQ